MSNSKPSRSFESFLKDLWNRRFFQFLAAFLGSGWALIQFSEWLVARYEFESTHVDRLALFLLFILPAFCVFVYNHGKPGPDDWLFFEKVFIPLNIIIAILLPFLLISDDVKTYEEVEIETIEGDTISRIVASRNAIKLLSIFPFANNSNDTSLNFLSLGIAEIIEKDLLQEFRIYPINPIRLFRDTDLDFIEFLDKTSYAQKLSISKGFPTDYMLSGKFNLIESEYTFEFQLVDVENGEELINEEVRGPNFYKLSDQITDILLQTLFPNIEMHQFETIDLPAEDLISSSIDALQSYILGYTKLITHAKSPRLALPYFEKAVVLDKNCALCYYELGNTKILIDGFNAGLKDIEKAVDKAMSLYDRIRFELQERYYYVKQDYDSQEKLLKMIMRIYPYDIQSYASLISYYSSNKLDEGIKVAELAVERGFGKTLNKKIGDLHYKAGNYEEALNYYEDHLMHYPKEKLTRLKLIDTYLELEDFETARTLIQENILLFPNEIQPILKQATFERRIFGKFDIAYSLLQTALSKASNPVDSSDVFKKLSLLSNQMGKVHDAMDYLEKSKELMYKEDIPIIVDFQNLNSESYLFWEAGLGELMLEKISDYAEEYNSMISMTEALFYMDYAQVFLDSSIYFKYYPTYRDSLIAFYGSDSKMEIYFDAYSEYLSGNACEALKLFKNYYHYRGIEMTEVSEVIIYSAIECGDYEAASELISGNLKSSPHWPLYKHIEARILLMKGKDSEARKANETAMNLLRNADQDNVVLKMVKTLEKSTME